MIIEIENENTSLGAVEIVENNQDGEIEIRQATNSLSVADIDFDDIFDTNQEKVRIQINQNIENIADICIKYGYLLATETTMDTDEQVDEMIESFNNNDYHMYAKSLNEKVKKIESQDDFCSYDIFDAIITVFNEFLSELNGENL